MDDLWSALPIPAVSPRWLGEVEGDLRQGGEFHARYFASGWEGTCRVEVCQPPQRLLILTKSPDEPDGVIEATLPAEGEQTILVIEDRGLPWRRSPPTGQETSVATRGRGGELRPAY